LVITVFSPGIREYMPVYHIPYEAPGRVDGWGAVLQAGRSWFRLGFTQLLTEMSTRIVPGD
jgi:hypothetical protein